MLVLGHVGAAGREGLSMMLTIVLQVLILMGFISRRRLFKSDESISGLVPGNPNMKTTRPTTERLLSQFDNLHLLIQDQGKKISAVMVEELKPLQQKTLSILQLPEEIYDLSFKHGKKNSALESERNPSGNGSLQKYRNIFRLKLSYHIRGHFHRPTPDLAGEKRFGI